MLQRIWRLTYKKNEQIEILLLSLTLLVIVIGLSQASQMDRQVDFPQTTSTVSNFSSPEIGE